MIIVHVAKIRNHKSTGVNVVVPEHIINQAKTETVFFYNVNDEKIVGLEEFQLSLSKGKAFAERLTSEIGKPTLVVFHEVNYIEYIAISKSLNKANIPYIILPHGEISEKSLQRKRLKKKLAYFLFFNRFLLAARGIQCLTENEANNITVKTPEKFIGGNGVYLPERFKTSFHRESVKLIYIGRLDVNHKGIDFMLEAIGSIKDFCVSNRVTLDLYGPDTNGRGDEIRNLIETHDLSNFVQLHDAVFGEEKEKLLLDSDIFIQTSRYEGLPTGILEAMSYGIPCLVTEGTNMEKAWEVGACYYGGKTPWDIASAIKAAVVNKNEWERISQLAMAFIEKNFLWSKVSRENIESYKRILGEFSEEK